MPRQERASHPEFEAYCEDIVAHRNFNGFPVYRKSDGGIRWVAAKSTGAGRERTSWWMRKAEERELPTTGKWISVVVKDLHPFGKKPCQICGRWLSIRYVYPNKTTMKAINRALPGDDLDYHDFLSIHEIADMASESYGRRGHLLLAAALKLDWRGQDGLQGLKEAIDTQLVQAEKKLSPGAMSNAPDRLDGYHTYNICCRSREDTGRHASNMSTYNQDRRAYEHWAEGGLKAASRMMRAGAGVGDCAMDGSHEKMTADHIGPISLGFAHRHDGFQPLCASCQGSKRDRLFPRDVRILLEHEAQGSTVVSWHVRGLWDQLKNQVRSDRDGEQLSILMKRNQRAFHEIFHYVYDNGWGTHLLQFLDPEQFYYDVEFVGVIRGRYTCDEVRWHRGSMDQYRNNAGRYLRASFDALGEYVSKANRRTRPVSSTQTKRCASRLIRALRSSQTIPRGVRGLFEVARRAKDKNHRSRLMLDAWQAWDEEGRPVDEDVDAAIRAYMRAIWAELEREW